MNLLALVLLIAETPVNNMLRYHKILLRNFILLLIVYFLCRIAFYAFNHTFFPEKNIWQFLKICFNGLRFDISAIVTINIPFIFLFAFPWKLKGKKWYGITLKIIFVLINTIGITFNCIDFAYYPFTLKRTTADIFAFATMNNDVATLIPQFLKDFWYVWLIWIAFILLLIKGYEKVQSYVKQFQQIPILRFILIEFLFFCVYITVTVIGIRGGLQLKPITIVTAGQYVGAEDVALIINTPYAIIKTIDYKAISQKKYFNSIEEAEQIYSPIHSFKASNVNIINKKNVVIIILESFSKEHSWFLNKHIKADWPGYMPFLDSLMQKSYVFTNAFANGKRSIESLPAIFASIPSLMSTPYTTSLYSGNKIYALPQILKKQGYCSMFFHGCRNGSMGFDDFCKLVGIDEYHGKNEFNNDAYYDGSWGIFDEEFLQYSINIMDKSSKPFLAGIFTLSSHHPYALPEKYKNKFKEGKLPIQRTIAYTDFALQLFFDTISQKPWYNNTIFIITADHTSESYTEPYSTAAGSFAIPLLIYAPGDSLTGLDTQVAQQSDIMPIVLQLLNNKENYVAFGRDIFSSAKQIPFAIQFFNEMYQLITDDYLIQFDGEKMIACYNWKTDTLLQNNLVQTLPDSAKRHEPFLKAFIQSYQHRIINNKITP